MNETAESTDPLLRNGKCSKDCIFGAIIAAGLLARASSTFAAEAVSAIAWYKGVVHAHANWGAPQLPTTSPDVVVRWYREHNYNFVAVTDLNYYTPPEGLKALFDAPGRFLVVPGIEPSKDPIQPGNKIVDTIGIGVRGPVNAPQGDTVVDVLDREASA